MCLLKLRLFNYIVCDWEISSNDKAAQVFLATAPESVTINHSTLSRKWTLDRSTLGAASYLRHFIHGAETAMDTKAMCGIITSLGLKPKGY
jgi:hypothetical protein